MALSPEALQEAVDLIREHGTIIAASRASGIKRSTLQDRVFKAKAAGLFSPTQPIPGFDISRYSSTVRNGQVVSESIQQKPAEAMGRFNVPDGHYVKGVSALVDAEGNVKQQWLKTAEGQLDPLTLAETIKSAFEEWSPPSFEVPMPIGTDADLLTIYPIADAHLGLRAVADESGADFDLAIAAQRFRETSARLFDRSPNSGTGLILQLGDWTHVDDDLALTPTSKHTLQVSDRLLDIVKCGVDIMKDYIYHALTKHERVIVKCLKGNHDLHAWISLYVGISEHFRDNERVIVDSGAADYWFFRWGSTLIGAHHGHRLKPDEMAGAMAMECRQDWGETDYRIFLHGHLHHLIVKEVLGVRVECFRTLAEADQHHSGKYGSGKSLTSITIHKTDGEDGRSLINLPPVKKRAVKID